MHDRQDLALGGLGRVAEELAGPGLLLDVEPDRVGRGLAAAGPGGAGAAALLGHGGVEAIDIDRLALGAQRILGQVEREAVGVIELEGDLAGQGATLAEPAAFLGQKPEPALQQGAELHLLQLQRLGHQRLGALTISG